MTPTDHIPAAASAFPASYSQTRLWVVEQLAPGDPTYHLPLDLRLEGDLNPDALIAAVHDLADRHEAFRTGFDLGPDGEVRQLIHPGLPFEVEHIDFSSLDDPTRSERMREATREFVARPFDLRRPPLFRARLSRLSDREHRLQLVLHHIVSDGWSAGIALRELPLFYAARSRGEPPPLAPLEIQYADYAVWQRDLVPNDHALEFWKQHLDQAPALSSLPPDFPRTSDTGHDGESITSRLPMETWQALGSLCRGQRATAFMGLLAAFATLVARLARQPDLVIGTPVVTRDQVELEGIFGIFLNLLPLRLRLEGIHTFRQCLDRVREIVLEAFSNQSIPYEHLLEIVHPQRTHGSTPLFQTLLNLLPEIDPDCPPWPGLAVHLVESENPPSKFDLTLYALTLGENLDLRLVYRTDLFRSPRMAELLRQFIRLVDWVTTHPDAPLATLSLVTPEARALLPDPAIPLGADGYNPVFAPVERHATAHPGQIAIEDAWGEWTYLELVHRSRQLAHALVQAGVGPGDVVAIHAVRGGAFATALMAVLMAGGAFLSLDSAYPAALLADRCRQTRPRVLLTTAAADPLPLEIAAALPELGTVRLPAIPATPVEVAWPWRTHPTSPVGRSIRPDQPASIVFTSGSTGEALAIVSPHGAASHFLAWQQREFGFRADDRFSLLCGLAHDPIVRDVFAPLWSGATLCIPKPDETSLNDWFVRNRITVTHLTPAMIPWLLPARPEDMATLPHPTLRLAFFGGDVLRAADVLALRAWATAVQVVNCYGATETPQVMGYHRVTDADLTEPFAAAIPVGRGIDQVQLLVLTASAGLAGIGEPGEICIRTPHLALGYLKDEELTSRRFPVNPFTAQAGDRLYRTGDLGRYLPDGSVELLGRDDDQVKIHGVRIEPETTRRALASHPEVSRCLVHAPRDPSGNALLEALVVPVHRRIGLHSTLLTHLRRRLPRAWVPTRLRLLDELPLTPNGKLDRQALLRLPPESLVAPTDSSAPLGPIEEALARLFHELLPAAGIDRHADFFERGGHSLLALRLLARVKTEMGFDLPLATFFRSPSVSALAAVLAPPDPSRASPSPPSRQLLGAPAGVPLFVVPGYFGLGGLRPSLVAVIREICPYDDRLRFAGVDDDLAPDTTVGAIADHLIAQIRVVHPESSGPLCLAGFSYGGTIAFEVACRLRAQGQEVPFLLLYDSRHSHSFAARSTFGVAREIVRRARAEPPGQRWRFVADLVRAKANAVRSTFRRTPPRDPGDEAPRQDPQPDFVPADVIPGVVRSGLLKQSVLRACMQATEQYQPSPYPGRVILFKATQTVRNEWLRHEPSPCNGWSQLVTGSLEIIPVPRDHLGIFAEPIHPIVLERTAQFLREAQSR